MSDTNTEVEKDIQVLETLQERLEDTKPVENPMEGAERSLLRFVDDAFDMTRTEFEFQKDIQDEIRLRLPKFSENQLIALASNTGVNSADKIAKTMNPWVQLAIARQQAQIQAESAERTAALQVQATTGGVSIVGSSMKDLNQTAPKEAIQGMASLAKILEFAIAKSKETDPASLSNTPKVEP